MDDTYTNILMIVLYFVGIFILLHGIYDSSTKNEVEDTDQNKIVYEITKHEYCYELEGKWLCYDEKK